MFIFNFENIHVFGIGLSICSVETARSEMPFVGQGV